MPPSPLLSLDLNPTLGVPIYRQIMEAVRGQIAAGLLKPGDRLPSIRELATHLRINPASAVKAYSELQHAGVISLDQGRGTFVSERSTVVAETRHALLTKEVQALLQRARSLGFGDDEILDALRRQLRRGRTGRKAETG